MRSRRSEFSLKVKEERYTYAKGKCEICGQDFGQRRPEYHHHPIPAALGGPATFGNCRCVCPTCHRIETKERDLPLIAKPKRIERKRIVKPSRSWRPRFRRHSKEMEERD